MTPTNPGPELPVEDADDLLVRALELYQAELDRGRQPDRDEFLKNYPDVAEELANCIDGLHFVKATRPRLTERGSRGEQSAPAARPDCAMPLGDFQIVREIGRGGMGVVYEATQLSLGRRVALKVLPFAATYDERQLQRFRTEAHAAAQLHHTNIVPVFAVGNDRGVHYYAMQLIDGQSLAVVIDRLRQQRDRRAESGTDDGSLVDVGPSTIAAALSTHQSTKQNDGHRTIARLIRQAALALEHAHAFGIVHRDVKPANLLIDQTPLGNRQSAIRLWITDFGLAQIQADAAMTQTGDVVGTLRYMSPEQAAGQRQVLDHRTDVYSLGATLYELATLEPIFDGRNRQHLLQQILQQEPRPPRTVDRSIPVELETIILKATNKNPQDRYATAQAMADDLERFLDDKPILARRPTLIDRARKWSRRHPSIVGAIVLILLLCIAGLLINNQLIAHEQAKTAQRAQEAEQQFRLARRAADEMIEIAEQELAEDPVQENLRKRLLETALEYYQDFSKSHGAELNAPELVATRDRVKRILDELDVLQGERRVFLLREPAVLDDLRLSGEKRSQVMALTKRLDEQRRTTFAELSQAPPDERRRRQLNQARENEAAVSAALGAAAMNRLRQIALQCQGSKGLREPAVAAVLKLTPEQKDAVRSIEMETFFARPEGPPSPGGFESRMRLGMERIINTVLMEEQAVRWKALVGEPYVGPLPFFMKMPPRPGGPDGPKGPPPERGQGPPGPRP